MDLKKILFKVKASLALFLLLIFVYFFLSGGNVFIPLEKITDYAFSIDSVENIFSFVFVHENLYHLAVNALTLLGYAIIIELIIGSLDVLAIFFFSTIISAMIYVLFYPNTSLIGASTGISGLAASALLLNPKKTVAFTLVLFLGLGLIATPIIFSSIDAEEQEIEQSKVVIEQQLEVAIQQGDVQKQHELTQRRVVVEQQSVDFKASKKFAEATPVDSLIHGIGAFFGLIYVAIFRRKKFLEGIRRILHPHILDFDKYNLFPRKR